MKKNVLLTTLVFLICLNLVQSLCSDHEECVICVKNKCTWSKGKCVDFQLKGINMKGMCPEVEELVKKNLEEQNELLKKEHEISISKDTDITTIPGLQFEEGEDLMGYENELPIIVVGGVKGDLLKHKLVTLAGDLPQSGGVTVEMISEPQKQNIAGCKKLKESVFWIKGFRDTLSEKKTNDGESWDQPDDKPYKEGSLICRPEYSTRTGNYKNQKTGIIEKMEKTIKTKECILKIESLTESPFNFELTSTVNPEWTIEGDSSIRYNTHFTIGLPIYELISTLEREYSLSVMNKYFEGVTLSEDKMTDTWKKTILKFIIYNKAISRRVEKTKPKDRFRVLPRADMASLYVSLGVSEDEPSNLSKIIMKIKDDKELFSGSKLNLYSVSQLEEKRPIFSLLKCDITKSSFRAPFFKRIMGKMIPFIIVEFRKDMALITDNLITSTPEQIMKVISERTGRIFDNSDVVEIPDNLKFRMVNRKLKKSSSTGDLMGMMKNKKRWGELNVRDVGINPNIKE